MQDNTEAASIRTVSVKDLCRELADLEHFASSLARQIKILEEAQFDTIETPLGSFRRSRRYSSASQVVYGPVHSLLVYKLSLVRADLAALENILVSTDVSMSAEVNFYLYHLTACNED